MNPFSPFGMPEFDPSKMDPKLLLELTQLIQQLPPEQLSRMQSLMHNAMAGLDVSREMEAFEKALPPGFREKIVALISSSGAKSDSSSVEVPTLARDQEQNPDLNIYEARLTVLKAVANGQMPPEEAEKILFG